MRIPHIHLRFGDDEQSGPLIIAYAPRNVIRLVLLETSYLVTSKDIALFVTAAAL